MVTDTFEELFKLNKPDPCLSCTVNKKTQTLLHVAVRIKTFGGSSSHTKQGHQAYEDVFGRTSSRGVQITQITFGVNTE